MRKPGPAWPYLALGLLVGGYGLYRRALRLFRPMNGPLAVQQGQLLTRRPWRVLAVTSHPDDLEIFVAGTLKLISLAGGEVTVAALTDGSHQYHRPSTADIRRQEQMAAATVLGCKDVRYLGLSDLSLASNPFALEQLRRVWEEVQPEVVLAYDPAYPAPFIRHPDHLAGGRLVLSLLRTDLGQGVKAAFYGTREPNISVDISDVMEDKVEALLCHRSQLKTWPRLYDLLFRRMAALMGRPVHLPYAETLRAATLFLPSPEAAVGVWPPQRQS